MIRVWVTWMWITCLGALISLNHAAGAPQRDGVRDPHAACDMLPSGEQAHIDLYNPIDWHGPVVVEIPVGRIATLGLIDWRRVRLVRGGREIPFSIHEGRPHWKTRLVAPVEKPRAEDRLVFSLPVATKTWVRVDVVRGQPRDDSALSRESDKVLIQYADLKVTIEETTGMLDQISVAGRDIFRARRIPSGTNIWSSTTF